VSPSGSPSSRAFKTLLIIFPERVRGNHSVISISSGMAMAPSSSLTCWRILSSRSGVRSASFLRMTNALIQTELSGILGWVEQLAALDVAGVRPLTGAADMALRLRDDAVTDGGIAERILANAPERAGDYFVVPKVVE